MRTPSRSTWPVVLFLGLLAAVGLGGAAAAAMPSEGGRAAWDEDEPQRITGTVLGVGDGRIVLDGLVAYVPVQARIGTLVVVVDDTSEVREDDTVDVVVRREGDDWVADELVLLDPD